MPYTLSPEYEAREIIYECSCPACDYHIAVPFYDGGYQPLAESAWPRSSLEAKNMLKLPLSFKRCVGCGHVYNSEFEDGDIPLTPFASSQLLFPNELEKKIDDFLPEHGTFVEISCGQGQFLHHLAQRMGQHCFVGFDPSVEEQDGNDTVELRAEVFEPLQHIRELKPNVLLLRHSLCDMKNPSAFLQTLDFAVRHEQMTALLLVEVSSIEGIFQTGAITSLYYEKHSHFTRNSLFKMLERSTQSVSEVIHSADEQTLYGLACLGGQDLKHSVVSEALLFWENAKKSKTTLNEDLARLHASGRQVAIWGEDGKSAAFLNYYELDQERFPIVVESNGNKIGSFIPGTGQEIQSPDFLKEKGVDVILVPMQREAKYVAEKVQQMGLESKILTVLKGKIIEFPQN